MCCVSVYRVPYLFVKLFLFELFWVTACKGHILSQGIADSRTFSHENPSNKGRLLQQVDNSTPSNHVNWEESSDENGDFLYEDATELSVQRSNKNPKLTWAENLPQFYHLQKKKSDDQLHQVHQSKDGANEVKSSFLGKENYRHATDLLYRQESDIDIAGSLPDILEKALRMSLFTVLNKPLSQDQQLLPDTCSVTNNSFYDRLTCLSDHQYELKPHHSSNYSEDLKAQMLKIYSTRNKTECGYRRLETPDKDITERVLCPFQWVVSQRNPSRIPEYLYEAKCSCPDCKEFKSRIPVLWRVGCKDKLHVYRAGWEEIVVACVPTKPPITNSATASSVDKYFPPPI